MYVYDAYVIQCALESNSQLITLDKRMAQIAVQLKLKILEAG